MPKHVLTYAYMISGKSFERDLFVMLLIDSPLEYIKPFQILKGTFSILSKFVKLYVPGINPCPCPFQI